MSNPKPATGRPSPPASCSTDIYRLEEAMKGVLALAVIAHGNVMRTMSDDGPAHPSLALMELSLRALRQGNDAARYARHALSVPSNKKDQVRDE